MGIFSKGQSNWESCRGVLRLHRRARGSLGRLSRFSCPKRLRRYRLAENVALAFFGLYSRLAEWQRERAARTGRYPFFREGRRSLSYSWSPNFTMSRMNSPTWREILRACSLPYVSREWATLFLHASLKYRNSLAISE